MKNNHHERFELRQLWTSQKTLWIISWVLGIITVLSVLGLVAVSGWFITMAGVAGVLAIGLNYFAPSAMIRAFALSRTLARYGDLMVSHHAVFELLKELRVRFFTAWAKQPLSVQALDDKTSSQKMHRLVKDIDVLNEFPLRVVSPFIVAVVAVAVVAVCLLIKLPTLLGVVLSGVLCSVLVIPVLMWRLGVAMAVKEGELGERQKSTLLDTLPTLTQLLVWGRWQEYMATLGQLDDEAHTLVRQSHVIRRRTNLMIQIVIAAVVVGVLFAVHEPFTQTAVMATDNIHVSRGFNPAWALALVLAVFGLIEIVMALVAEPLAYGRSMYAKERINALITPVSATPKVGLSNPSQDEWTLMLNDVAIQAPNAIVVIDNIHAHITNQTPTLIVGASGVGKSTLLATLAGEFAPVKGEIILNGQSMPNIDFGSSLGFLGQTVDIFDQTLADNLRLGKAGASDEELWAVLGQVGLADWVKSQPKGLGTPLGEYGMALSGGQARRVALARLLLTPKTVLLLDEPFAGLDDTTRRHVWQTLTDAQKAGRIGILVIATHQLWAEMDAEVLVVGE
ncbi:MAG: ATP-binding cassette domain-containing protein [Moraxella sp.]|uniref:amino acid ABC transporter ATP-binding/permease protein n=1 Tax=Moraxella sp. TaxID=479 RepID=UPI0026DD1538|nr:ATP-binding cassette domain-containing protein [Moraxella sp.]MDO4450123.1 ATP-binding cassette domain-containing protein [Moraxella sp.]